MTFYETHIFTDQIVDLIDDDSYAELQATLIVDPEAGDLMLAPAVLGRFGGRLRDEVREAAFGLSITSSTAKKCLCFTLTRRTRERISQQIKFGGLETLLTSI